MTTESLNKQNHNLAKPSDPNNHMPSFLTYALSQPQKMPHLSEMPYYDSSCKEVWILIFIYKNKLKAVAPNHNVLGVAISHGTVRQMCVFA